MTLFGGLLAYPITPADADGRVDVEALQSLLDRLVSGGVDGIGLLGSTGGYMYLDRGERRRAVRAAVECVAGRVPVSVGIGALRTDAVQALARDAAEEGADGVLLAPVSYTPLLDDELFAHVQAVSAATELPLCLYDNPATTGVRFEDALLRRIGSLPRVVAIKRPAPDPDSVDVAAWLATQRALFEDGFRFGCSVDWHAARALLAGADAWHGVLAGVLPQHCVTLVRAAGQCDHAAVVRADEALSAVWALFKRFGSMRVVYAMAERLGVGGARPPRPILPLDGAAMAQVEAVLATRLSADAPYGSPS